MSNITTAISRDHKPRYKCLHSKESRLTDQTCQSSRKMYRRPFSSGSSSNTGSSTDTTTSGGSLKKTMFQTYEGQKCSEWSALPDCMLNPVITIDMAIVMENRASEHMHYILIGPSVLTVGFSETTLGCFQPPGCR